MMVFKKIPDDLDQFNGDIVVAVVGSDEKPLKATNAWLDWRLFGTLNELMARGYFNAGLGEKCMIPTYGRFEFDRLVLLGAGPLFDQAAWPETESGRDVWKQVIQHIEATLASLKVNRVGLSLPRYELADQERALLQHFERAHLPTDLSLFLSRLDSNPRPMAV